MKLLPFALFAGIVGLALSQTLQFTTPEGQTLDLVLQEGENPMDAAQRFINDNNLSPDNLAMVVERIEQMSAEESSTPAVEPALSLPITIADHGAFPLDIYTGEAVAVAVNRFLEAHKDKIPAEQLQNAADQITEAAVAAVKSANLLSSPPPNLPVTISLKEESGQVHTMTVPEGSSAEEAAQQAAQQIDMDDDSISSLAARITEERYISLSRPVLTFNVVVDGQERELNAYEGQTAESAARMFLENQGISSVPRDVFQGLVNTITTQFEARQQQQAVQTFTFRIGQKELPVTYKAGTAPAAVASEVCQSNLEGIESALLESGAELGGKLSMEMCVEALVRTMQSN